MREGSEESLDSEKYEVKKRRLDGPLLPLLRRLNAVRARTPPDRRGLERLMWLETESEHLLGYARCARGSTW